MSKELSICRVVHHLGNGWQEVYCISNPAVVKITALDSKHNPVFQIEYRDGTYTLITGTDFNILYGDPDGYRRDQAERKKKG